MRIAVALLLLALACGTSEDDVASHLQDAQSYEAEAELDAALIELKLALALSPQDAEINHRIGRILETQRKLGEAIYYYSEASRLDPSHVEALLAEAALVRHVDLDQAEKRLTQAVEVDPSNATALLRLSHVQRQADKLDLALATAEEGLALEPENGRLYCARGAVFAAQSKNREQAVSAHPKLDAALADVARCAELSEPGDIWGAELERAQILSSWPGREAEAASAYAAALEASAKAEGGNATVNVGRAALRFAREQGDAALTRSALERLVAARPEQLAVWTELAFLESREGGDPQAIYERTLQAMPTNTRAHLAFAQYLHRVGRSDDALKLLRETSEGESGPPLDESLSALASLQIELGKREPEAAATIAELEKRFPGENRTRLARAEFDLAMGRVEPAAESLKELSETSPGPEVYQLLAAAQFGARRLPQAGTAADRAIELDPRDAASRALRARILMARGDYSAARHDLRWIASRARRLTPTERVMFARCLYESGDEEKGRELLSSMVEAERPFALAVTEWVRREGSSDTARARELLEAAQEANPTHPGLLARAAALDLEAGNDAAARERIERAVELAPDSVEVLLVRARLHSIARELEAAEQDARSAFALAPERFEAANLLVQVLGVQGREAEAVAILDAANASVGLPARTRVLLARLHAQAGDTEQASALFEAALAARSNLPLAKNDLAFLLAVSGENLERAGWLAAEAHQVFPDDPRVLHTLGYVLLRQGNFDLAAPRLEEAVASAEKLGQERASYQYHLGLALRMTQRNRSAAKALGRALELDPAFADAETARRERAAALAGDPPPESLF